MAGFACPHCGNIMTLTRANSVSIPIFMHNNLLSAGRASVNDEAILAISYIRCPSDACQKTVCKIIGLCEEFRGIEKQIYPKYKGTPVPENVPDHIANDYIEACMVLEDSPKASATMSRRCLQGMIRDFWEISKNNLHSELEALRGRIDGEIIDTLQAFKSIANIGAHPERNSEIDILLSVGDTEAQDLIQMIEFLFDDWYVRASKTKSLFNRIRSTHDNKKLQRESSSDTPTAKS